jgi:hypothetical protein
MDLPRALSAMVPFYKFRRSRGSSDTIIASCPGSTGFETCNWKPA